MRQGYAVVCGKLLPAGQRFLNRAQNWQGGEEVKFLKPLLAFSIENHHINVEQVGEALDWLESVYMHNKKTSFEPAFMVLCVIAMAVRTFVETYLQRPNVDARNEIGPVLSGEVVLEASNVALEALFSLVGLVRSEGKSADEKFDPWDSICSGIDLESNLGRISPSTCSNFALRLTPISRSLAKSTGNIR